MTFFLVLVTIQAQAGPSDCEAALKKAREWAHTFIGEVDRAKGSDLVCSRYLLRASRAMPTMPKGCGRGRLDDDYLEMKRSCETKVKAYKLYGE